MTALQVINPREILAGQLRTSLDVLKASIGLELVLHQGVHDVKYRRGHTIRVVWAEGLSNYLVTTISLVSAGHNSNSTVSFRYPEEVLEWLLGPLNNQ